MPHHLMSCHISPLKIISENSRKIVLTCFNGYDLRVLVMIFLVIKNYLPFVFIINFSQLTEKGQWGYELIFKKFVAFSSSLVTSLLVSMDHDLTSHISCPKTLIYLVLHQYVVMTLSSCMVINRAEGPV
jgi:hypothetical protein